MWMKFIANFNLILLLIPLSLQAEGETGENSEMNAQPSYVLDVLDLHPLDPCKSLEAYMLWIAYDKHKEWWELTRDEAKEMAHVNIDAHSKPREILTGYAIDLVYDRKGLRETEKAFFKRCRFYNPITDKLRKAFSTYDKMGSNTK